MGFLVLPCHGVYVCSTKTCSLSTKITNQSLAKVRTKSRTNILNKSDLVPQRSHGADDLSNCIETEAALVLSPAQSPCILVADLIQQPKTDINLSE